MEHKNDEQEVIETPAEEETFETSEDETEENHQNEEDIEAIREKLQKAEKEKEELAEKNKKLYARLKKTDEKPSQETVKGLNDKDIYALIKADVPEEDIDEVKAYASYKKISVAEAVKDKMLQSILSDKEEERRTANAVQTRGNRGTSKVSGETLIEKARKGEDVKIDDIDKLVAARINRLKDNK